MRVLVTRPEPDSQATGGRLRALGHDVVRDPLLVIEPLPEAVLPAGRFDAVVLTSVNGARALAERPELMTLRGLPLYAVGWRTAAAAPPGFARQVVAGGNGAALAALLRAELAPRSCVLHVCGEERAVDLGAELAADGHDVGLFTVYRARAAGHLLPATEAAIRGRQIDAAFHFSPRTAATLVGLATQAGLAEHCAGFEHLCFSRNVAAPLAHAGWPTRIAAEPTEDGLFALLST
ncbi:uroporphyrinogen-III synthase [Ancylobacter sp. A5.8]|uniref:uroporphyrinogen-III synthase n=1 Tax=Ancylobacter gelatini TaxID=2919920 RepID=UPI001F4D802F|nr:uroporphyrinogen-III synthase [Ancylobacter gelatini]MCJ8144873.1 uroporphyrinogen-III synthase [Ancylobacter gelatini]